MTTIGINSPDSLAVRGHIIESIKTAFAHGIIMDSEIGLENGS